MRKWKRRLTRWGLAGLTLILIGVVAGYALLTDPARLRRQALAALQRLPFEQVDVAHVTFSPWSGVHIHDLTLIPDLGRETDGDPVPPLTIRIADATIHTRLAPLLAGELRPSAIDIADASLTLIVEAGPAAREWSFKAPEFGTAEWHRLRRLLSSALAPLHIGRADVRLMLLEDGGAHLRERWVVQLDGVPQATGYQLEVHERPAAQEPLLALHWTDPTGELEIGLADLELDALRHVLPTHVTDALDALDFDATARVRRMTYDFGPPDADLPPPDSWYSDLESAEIELQHVRCGLPLEDDTGFSSDDAPPAGCSACFLQFHGGEASLTYQAAQLQAPGRIRLTLQGRLNQADVTVGVTADGTLLQRVMRDLAADPNHPEPAGFSLDDIVHARFEVSNFTLPTQATAPALLRSTRLSSPVRAAFEDYLPSGEVDLTVEVLPPGDTTSSDRILAHISTTNARCRYFQFPYEFHDIRGTIVRRDGHMYLENLCGRHGLTDACATGIINNSDSWTGFDLVFTARNAALTRDLYDALPGDFQHLWAQAAPVGICDLRTHITRPDGDAEHGSRHYDLTVDAELLRGSLSLADDRRINRATGTLHVRDRQITIDRLAGYDGDTLIELGGVVEAVGDTTESELRVALQDFPVTYVARVGADPNQPPQQVTFAGTADVWGRVYGGATDDSRRHQLAAQIKSGTLTGFDPARPWHDARGWVLVTQQTQQVLAFTAEQDGAHLNATGTIPVDDALAGGLVLDLDASSPTLETLLPQFVPNTWLALVKTLGLSGDGTINVRLRPTTDSHDAAGQIATVALHAAHMRADPLPLELHGVSANLIIQPDRFELQPSQAAWGTDGTLTANGTGRWVGDDVDLDFVITATNLVFGPELTAALPPRLGALLETLNPTGTCDALISRLNVQGPPDRRQWTITGRLPVRAANFSVGLPVQDLNGTLWGDCAIDPNGDVTLNTQFEIASARLADRQLHDWQGQLVREPGSNWVRLVDLHGGFCGGEAVAFVSLDPDSKSYELAITLQDVAAAELFPAPDADADPNKPRPGIVDGKVRLQGQAGDDATRRGGGDLRIRGASFLQDPVMARVAEASPEVQPDDTIDQADLRFLWEGSQLRLLRVEIQSQGLRLIGEGTWNLDDDALRMTLVGAHPRNWPRVLLLTDILEYAGQELIEYEVRGTLSKPDVTARPLHRVSDAIRALLGTEE